MILDWTNWTFWLITLALVAFGFCLRDIYDQWYLLNRGSTGHTGSVYEG
jgi:hypothetical protein